MRTCGRTFPVKQRQPSFFRELKIRRKWIVWVHDPFDIWSEHLTAIFQLRRSTLTA
jgi:hypothetical protein